MNSQILVKINSFFKNRLIELTGILLMLCGQFVIDIESKSKVFDIEVERVDIAHATLYYFRHMVN